MVSVIIPNYNHAFYLQKRIESVLNQVYNDFEIIILDDCSKDESRQVILKFAEYDKRITTLFNSNNSGSVFKQWAKGLSLAKGDYIWIAESDDYAEPTFLSTLVPLLEKDETLSFAYTNSLIVNEHNDTIGEISDIKKRIFDTDHWNHDFVVDGISELNQYLSLQCTVNNASAVLFRRSSIEAVGGVDTTFRFAGDWMMYIKLSLHGNIAYIAQCLNNYREHEVNASKKSFNDGSQLYERQKCFAFTYKSTVLNAASLEVMLQQASVEYLKLSFLLVREKKQVAKALETMAEISKISLSYFLQVQYRAIKLTNMWTRLASLVKK
jgi:glycosyltransferase involved in cell wall biosynthesis